ncbi:TrpR repssor-like protein [Paracholeplasma brassicae]|uniref:TrpR repssor-like protein n=1 Tax=Acholeplasma brassicae TaxID=61635 RepID=U4KP94_9MOLU|nr:YerC/YecD family TrpR-related protein [Paracholeplasma brassicae]CCV66170.1 TrpR repssor-like protein [Paracholeplasma brassicae]
MAYKSKFATKEIDKLFEAILTLKSVEECYKLFEDLCTIKEIQDMSQRLLVAKLLNEGVSYQNISKETLASSATISRVAKSLSYGADGYKLVLERTSKTTK